MNSLITNADIELIEVFDKDLLDYLARRHNTSANRIVSQFLKQSNIGNIDNAEYGFALEANEVEIMKDYYLRSLPVI